jgi:hypothetical protein
MSLKLRPTGLGSGIDKDRPSDYTVYTGEWEVGRLYQTRGGPDSLRWFWALTVNGPMTRSDRIATLKEAKAQFQKSWDAWKAWAKNSSLQRMCCVAPTTLACNSDIRFSRMATRSPCGGSWAVTLDCREHVFAFSSHIRVCARPRVRVCGWPWQLIAMFG